MRIFEQKNRTKLYTILVIAVIVFGGVAFAMQSTGAMEGSATDELGGTAQCSYDYALQGVDEDGNLVDIPVDVNPLQSAFMTEDGVAITSLTPSIDWSATGDGIDWETFSVTTEVKIYVATGSDGDMTNDGGIEYTLVNTLSDMSTSKDGSWSEILILGSDIAADPLTMILGSDLEIYSNDGDVHTYPGEGWYYKFEFSVTASATDILDQPITEKLNLGAFGFWIEYGAEINLSGGANLG